MKIIDFLKKENCIASLNSRVKDGALKELADLLVSNKEIEDRDLIFKALMDREKLGSTGIGGRVAIPHAKIKGIDFLIAAFGRSDEGIEYDSVDDQPVRWIFLLLASENSTGVHLKALAKISRLLKSDRFRKEITRAKTSEEIYKLIKEEDSKLV